MTAEELQNAIQALKNSIELFSAQLEAVALGIPTNAAANAPAPSIIKTDDQIKSLEDANKLNGDVGPSDIKFIDELHKKFKPLFDELKPKTSAASDAEASDTEDVLKDEAAEKATKVSIVSISEEALESIKDALKPKNEAQAAGGGGFLSGIIGLLGGAGVAAAGGGLLTMLTSLPLAIPGILVALGAIIGAALAFSAAVTIVVKTLSWLKDDIVELFPVVDKFVEIFIKIATSVIPVVAKALADFATTVLPVLFKALADFTAIVLPPLMEGFTKFASIVIPAVIKAIAELMSSPGFKFLAGEFIALVSQSVKMLGDFLMGTVAAIKSIITDTRDVLVSLFEVIRSIVSDVKDALVSLFEGIRGIVSDVKDVVLGVVVSFERTFKSLLETISSISSDVKDVILGIAEPVERVFKSLFENISKTLIPVSKEVKEALDAISKQVKETVFGALEKIDAIFSKIPDVIGSVFDKIAEFSNKVTTGKIGDVAREIGALAVNLTALTASDLLGSIASFFTDSPFDKIIDFQNKIDKEKFSLLSMLAPSLQKLVDVNADQLKGLGSVIDELLNKSMQVSATVEKIFSGSGWFKKSGGILEIVDKLEDAKQGAENTITAVMVKTSDAQRKVSELQLNETKMTNRILNDIFRKMDALNINATSTSKASRPNAIAIDESLPLQFTSTNTRQQILQSGNSK